eukprot:Mycagemm_TRINITY_DN10370_c2_g4::TRINITY_DN10370_c2_g4_i1::g.1105::m.1105 type:complete len:123 gc:universal TRINITY_DN10370_c2_g4_i1:53-421(+)
MCIRDSVKLFVYTLTNSLSTQHSTAQHSTPSSNKKKNSLTCWCPSWRLGRQQQQRELGQRRRRLAQQQQQRQHHRQQQGPLSSSSCSSCSSSYASCRAPALPAPWGHRPCTATRAWAEPAGA